MSVEHVVKCWPNYFDAIARKEKTFDVRCDDRGYQKGDTIKFQKYDPQKAHYIRNSFDTGTATVTRKIVYVLTGGQFGIEPGYVVLGLK